jgi:CDP-2,3-bis-(O-geranylgeranyl)-sn-glycerol synthase
MSAWVTALLFFLPAGVANMAPLFANKIPGLSRWGTPLDFGASYKGSRILGQNKTVRGVVFGTLLALVAGYIIIRSYSLPYADSTYVLGAALMGLGALLGDATESFLKRRRGIKPGQKWFPFDQLDYIAGGLLLSAPLLSPSFGLVLRVTTLYFGLHLLVSYLGYLLGFKDAPI